MAKVKYKMKDPETWLPVWARGKNLPVLKLKVAGVEYDVPPEYQHGGFEVEVDDDAGSPAPMDVRDRLVPWAMRLAVDPRFSKVEE